MNENKGERKINWVKIVATVFVFAVIVFAVWKIADFAKPGGLPWSGGSAFSAYEMSNGHYTISIPSTKVYMYTTWTPVRGIIIIPTAATRARLFLK